MLVGPRIQGLVWSGVGSNQLLSSRCLESLEPALCGLSEFLLTQENYSVLIPEVLVCPLLHPALLVFAQENKRWLVPGAQEHAMNALIALLAWLDERSRRPR